MLIHLSHCGCAQDQRIKAYFSFILCSSRRHTYPVVYHHFALYKSGNAALSSNSNARLRWKRIKEDQLNEQ